MKIANMPKGHVQAPRYAYPGEGVAGEPVDSYEGFQSAKPHWLARLPGVGRVVPFLSLTACGFGSSCSTEAKVGAGVALVTGAVALYHFLSRRINNRRIAALPSPIQIMKGGTPRLRFPRKLDSAEKVITHYTRKGFPEVVARKIAYAWFFHKVMFSEGIGDLNQYDLQKRDLYGIASSFSNPEDFQFDNELPDVMERIGCSGSMGSMLNALDRGIRTVPELANIFLAFNLKVYHIQAGNPFNVLEFILSKFGNKSREKYEISERDVGRMFESSKKVFRSDNKIVRGVTHLLLGGMALDAFESRQFDGGLELGFAHIWSARRTFEGSSSLKKLSLEHKSIGTVTDDYPYALSRRALDLWEKSFPRRAHPKTPWSTNMLPATTTMLQSFTVKPV